METIAPPNLRILVPLDGSPLATQAIAVARALGSPGSTLILCRVVPAAALDDGPAPDPVDQHTHREADASLRAIAARFLPTGERRVEIVVSAGDPAERILAAAKERSAEMIVMSSRGRGAGGRLLFGSVADLVSRTASVPVVVVHPTDGEEPAVSARVRRLVVPLDETPASQRAIPVAAALASRRRFPVLLVSAVDSSRIDSPIAGYAAAMSDRIHDNVMGRLKHDALGHLERAGARLMREGIVATWRLLSGTPARVIPAVLAPGDLVVLADQRLDGVERWWRGDLAAELIQSGAAPVMVVGVDPLPAMMEPLVVAESTTHM